MKVERYTSPATVSRRQFLLLALAGAAGIRAVALADDRPTAPSLPRDGFLPDGLRAMEATAAAFMKKHDVPGLSVAIARKGRLAYADGYGLLKLQLLRLGPRDRKAHRQDLRGGGQD